MVCVSCVTVITSDIVYVFVVSSVKRSSSLSDVFQWTVHAFHSANAASMCGCGVNIFCTVFCVQNATFIFVSRKGFATFLTSLPLYINYVPWKKNTQVDSQNHKKVGNIYKIMKHQGTWEVRKWYSIHFNNLA
jgi:hypothetical protein